MRAASSLGLCIFVFGCGTTVGPQDAPTARVRVAHLSPDAPDVDFCLAPHGTTDFIGPVLGANGGPLGMAYGQVTKYFDLEAQQYDVRLVAPGAQDCAKGLVPDFTDLPELTDGATATIAAIGKLGHGSTAAFTLRAYIDDAVIEPGKSKLRFIHASPGTPGVDVGIGGGVLFTPVFSNIEYGSASSITAAPAAGIELSARAHETTSDVLSIKPAALTSDANATAIAIGEIGNADAPLQVLLCNDSSPPHGLHTECNLVGGAPERARIRVAHLSPDAPAVDVCLSQTGANRWQGPLLASLGAPTGLSYPQITTYVSVPITTYDVRVVLAGASTCATPAVADTVGIGVAPGISATIAALGDLARENDASLSDPGFRLKAFVDDTTVDPAKAKLRFIHASPGTPAVDVGLGTSTSWSKVFANVAFSSVATNSPMNDRGYVETAPFTSPVSARLVGSSADALVMHVQVTAGSINTAFAIGGKSGSTTNPLRVLLCRDSAQPLGLLTTCHTN
ncbi:MAG TPA: DUF4397 domain-containing protein [Kofleriaceae bacterium]|nr:DUF4397 domain-containing protein [Kofleriaceae bacterium]